MPGLVKDASGEVSDREDHAHQEANQYFCKVEKV